MSFPVRIALSLLDRPDRHRYGGDRSQHAELRLPTGSGPFPVVVLLHGGSWTDRFSRVVMRPLARDLARRGMASWNVEFRRLGGGGGWPATFLDVAAGIDALADLADPRLDLTDVSLVGHSSGGQLALWAAGRSTLPGPAVGASPRVIPARVVALAPVTQLQRSGDSALALMGSRPAGEPERWRQADPMCAAPLPVPLLLVHPGADVTIPAARSREYVERARNVGSVVTLVTPDGEGHRDAIDPTSRSWRSAAEWLMAQR